MRSSALGRKQAKTPPVPRKLKGRALRKQQRALAHAERRLTAAMKHLAHAQKRVQRRERKMLRLRATLAPLAVSASDAALDNTRPDADAVPAAIETDSENTTSAPAVDPTATELNA